MVGCELKRVMDLEINFRAGTCGTYIVQNEEKVLLCFGDYRGARGAKRCDWWVYSKLFANNLIGLLRKFGKSL